MRIDAQAQLPQQVLPVPLPAPPPAPLAGDASEMEQASLGFIHFACRR
jgi:hypothetical protein